MSDAASFVCCSCGCVEYEPFLDDVPDRLGILDGTFSYVSCKRCALIAQFPRPSYDQTVSFYPKSFWRTEEAAAPSSLSKRAEVMLRERLIKADFSMVAGCFKPGLRHLDVGCATGDFLELCRSRGTISRGIELSASAVEYCRTVRGLDVVEGDLVEHDFAGETFDVISYNGVLEHVPNPHEHLLKCRKLLKQDGKLVVLGIPNINSAGFKLARARWIGLDVPRHIHQFSTESLTGLLQGAGFSVAKVEPRSPRFNPPSLVASLIPGLHRHRFDAYEAETGRNPVLRKGLLFALLQVSRPLDALLCQLGLSEHITVIAEPKSSEQVG